MVMKKKTFTSLEKAVDILDLFDLDKREFSAQEISETLNLPLSSVYKYIDFLVHRQLLRHKPNSKMYGLGFMITRLSYVLNKDFNMADIVHPYLESLSQETLETAMVTIVVGDEAVCLDRVEPQRLVKLSLDPGRRLPLHTGSSSKILLAFQTETFVKTYLDNRRLEKLTDRTICDSTQLIADLDKIRNQGYSVSDSEVDIGARALSVPILDEKGVAVAGLTIAGPTERLDEDKLEGVRGLLKQTVEKIADHLGMFTRHNHLTIPA